MRFRILSVLFLAFAASGMAQPSFKGGSQALDAFLAKNIIYPEYSSQNCIAATIQVRFRVDEKGNVSQVGVEKGLGIDLDDEAVRVVKLTSGKWTVPPGYNPNYNVILPIRFDPDRTRCQGATDASMTLAIAQYKAQEGMQDAITNYYKNKYLGKADLAREAEIIAMKKQLGYDDRFIRDLLDQASQKLKQGDTEGACHDWNFIRNIGSNKADTFISQYCK
ncbi:energy transducer TonB [Mucilaginibacter sp. RS28]|uniref:Energy transducer TonB n=1 Tax=Mucilaginibacter straminoryzae TaxID=2932774 RepID=A0A9X1X4F6_9SPHI|nr:TonB family protein [Mucilaginibacter straminoryzae]MCJ8210879.1 energy transducer TonB [Mucilaginibacter straminoryzae]